MSASRDDIADQILADAAAQMLGAQPVASGSQPTSADLAAAMAMAAAAGLSPEEMAELAGGGSGPAPAMPAAEAAPSRAVATSAYVGKRIGRVAQERTLTLAIRTSLLCEFRNHTGLLQAFEVCYGQTTFGVLCAALMNMPGIEFINHDPSGWFVRPSQFSFKGELYEVSIPYDNIRIAPLDHGKALIEMEELLEYVRHNVLRSRAPRFVMR